MDYIAAYSAGFWSAFAVYFACFKIAAMIHAFRRTADGAS